MKLVSVIIPCFNYGAFLKEAIDSALAQSYAATEIMVVDDGSKDNTPEIARSYGSRILYVKTPNRGHGSALNEALGRIHGAYYICLDADNSLHPDYISQTVAVMEAAEPDVGYIYTQREFFGATSGISSTPPYDLAKLKVRNYIDSCALVRAEIGQRYGYDTDMIQDDYDFYLRLAGQGIRGQLLNRVLFRYRIHRGSMTHTITSQYRHLEAIRQILQKHPSLFNAVERAAVIEEARNRMLLAVLRNRVAGRAFSARLLDIVAILRGRATPEELKRQVGFLFRPSRYGRPSDADQAKFSG